VAEELAELTHTITASLIRIDEDAATIVGRVDKSGLDTFPLGTVLSFDGDSVIRRIRDTGRPARIDSYEGLPGTIAEQMLELGYSSVAGAPVTVAGRVWGGVLVESRDAEPLPLGLEDQLVEFGDLVAQAIENTTARQELQASRARIVEAMDAERRRLERNLHDGAQQRLVTLSLALRLAAAKLDTDPVQAKELLEKASAELAEGLAELRELARGIHPAVLTERGLAPALASLAERAAVPVNFREMVESRLPEPVEAAAYFVVAEALTNVAKYADANAVNVRVAQRDGTAFVEIADDGVGGADLSAGSGLRGLADRVEALGGKLEVESPPGEGTTLLASIPVAT
jgi:signal transduction histidine kinase